MTWFCTRRRNLNPPNLDVDSRLLPSEAFRWWRPHGKDLKHGYLERENKITAAVKTTTRAPSRMRSICGHEILSTDILNAYLNHLSFMVAQPKTAVFRQKRVAMGTSPSSWIQVEALQLTGKTVRKKKGHLGLPTATSPLLRLPRPPWSTSTD